MAKGYWIAVYTKVTNPDAVARYAAEAAPLHAAAGARYIVRGIPAAIFDNGQKLRTIVLEFPSVEAAVAVYNSPAYQAAAKHLKGAAERDLRIVEGA